MRAELARQLAVAADVILEFGLVSIKPALKSCQALARNEPLDVAVLGQFKSGKSSLLNALLGEPLLPVGVLPVTAVVTRVMAGVESMVRVSHLNGLIEEVTCSQLADFVTEAGNPANLREVAVVDVVTPALRDMQGVRLVDTPGLGSIITSNTEATRLWMPDLGAAMIAISAERPLSDEDLHLVAEARRTAARVIIVLTKVDLLSLAERKQVTAFIKEELAKRLSTEVPIILFSTRVDTDQWLDQLRKVFLQPINANVAAVRDSALTLKLSAILQSCREYLAVGHQSAERAVADRDRVRAAVLNEQVSADVIKDEIQLAKQGMCAGIRPAFEQFFLAQKTNITHSVSAALLSESTTWQGHLATQTQRYLAWMQERLLTELEPLSSTAASVASDLVDRAEMRFRRIVDAFRDRIGGNIQMEMDIAISPLVWEARRPELATVRSTIHQPFMTHWDLLWWLLPMGVVGGLFRRHIVGQVPWVVEMNLGRIVSEWTNSTNVAVADLSAQVINWVEAELNTLSQLLARQATELGKFREALQRLEELGAA